MHFEIAICDTRWRCGYSEEFFWFVHVEVILRARRWSFGLGQYRQHAGSPLLDSPVYALPVVFRAWVLRVLNHEWLFPPPSRDVTIPPETQTGTISAAQIQSGSLSW